MISFKKAPTLFLVVIISFLYLIIPVGAWAEKFRLEIKPDEPVWINTKATATATTDDPKVDQVVFEWIDPRGDIRKTFTDTEAPFQDSYILDEVGDWKVAATFGQGVTKLAYIRVVVTVIPELSTMIVMTAFFVALAGFAARKRL